MLDYHNQLTRNQDPYNRFTPVPKNEQFYIDPQAQLQIGGLRWQSSGFE